MRRLLRSVKSFVRDNEGQDLIEYVVLVSLIALVLVGSVTAAGGGVNNVVNNTASALGGGDGDDGDDDGDDD